MQLSMSFVGQTLRLPGPRDWQAERLPYNHSASSSETTRRFARRRDWNYAAAFCAELHRKSRSKSKAWSLKSIFCADTRPVCISIKSIITELSRTTLATGASWIALQIRAHLHWPVHAQAQWK